MTRLLLSHGLLLLLASTDFTAVTALFGGGSLRWEYFQYRFASGFGQPYVSEYSLLVVLTYCVAFACGALAYKQSSSRRLGSAGLILSVLGVCSFVLEASHRIFAHHLSWLAFSPIINFVIAGVSLWQPRNVPEHSLKPVELLAAQVVLIGAEPTGR